MSGDALDVVLFGFGDRRLGVEARQVRASRPAPCGEGHTRIETLLGLDSPAEPAGQPHLLTIRRAEGDRDVLVGNPVEMASLPVETIHPLPAFVAARTRLHGLRALAMADGQMTLLFDLASLI